MYIQGVGKDIYTSKFENKTEQQDAKSQKVASVPNRF